MPLTGKLTYLPAWEMRFRLDRRQVETRDTSSFDKVACVPPPPPPHYENAEWGELFRHASNFQDRSDIVSIARQGRNGPIRAVIAYRYLKTSDTPPTALVS